MATRVRADDAFRYPEASHGKGELKYINEIPVLLLEGSLEETGDQWGALALKPQGLQTIYSVILKTKNILLPQFPSRNWKQRQKAQGGLVIYYSLATRFLICGNSAIVHL